MGTRRYMRDFSGQSIRGSCGTIRTTGWLNEDLPDQTVSVALAEGAAEQIVVASAFVGVASACTMCSANCTTGQVVNNLCDSQRRHLDEDMRLWYQAYNIALYEQSVQP